MAYSTKFASGYYGPFRDVAESTPSFGDRRTYQMNVANRLEAISESLEDEKEGADILMVKPALAFLHKSAINYIPEFEFAKPFVKNDADFRSLCSQGFAEAFFLNNR